MFEIEKDKFDQRLQFRGKYPFRDMVVGDSFALPAAFRERIAMAASKFGARNGLKFSVRKQLDGTYRCGRIA